jgi:hypothetical protein
MSVSSRTSEQIGGSRNGNQTFNLTCPGNTIMTGVTLKAGGKIDRLVDITCLHPKDILGGTGSIVTPSGWAGGTGGSNYSLTCPPGSAVNWVVGTWNEGDTISSLGFGCKDVKTGKLVSNRSFGTNVRGTGTASLDTSRPNHYVGGFTNGNAGNLVDSLTVVMKDMEGLEDIYQNSNGTALACAGKYKDFSPYTKPYCDDYMVQLCKTSPTNPLCSCINSDVIRTAKLSDPNFPNCPQIYDSVCVDTGYKLAAYERAKCDYQNCQVNVNAAPVNSSVNIVQVCNFKDGSTVTNKENVGTLTGKAKVMASFKDNPMMWVVLLILIIVLPILGIFFLGGEEDTKNDPKNE